MMIALHPLTKDAALVAAQEWLHSPDRASGRRVVLPVFLVLRHGGQYASEWRMIRRARTFSAAHDRALYLAQAMAWGGIALIAVLESAEPEIWFFHATPVRRQKGTSCRQILELPQQMSQSPSSLRTDSLPLFANVSTPANKLDEP